MSITNDSFMDKLDKLQKECESRIQSVLDELQSKDELIATLYENIKVLEELVDIKNRMIAQLEQNVKDYKGLLEESVAQTNRALEIGNTMLKTAEDNLLKD